MLNIQIKMSRSGLSAVICLWLVYSEHCLTRENDVKCIAEAPPKCLAAARTPGQTLLTMPSESSSGNEEGASDYSL